MVPIVKKRIRFFVSIIIVLVKNGKYKESLMENYIISVDIRLKKKQKRKWKNYEQIIGMVYYEV